AARQRLAGRAADLVGAGLLHLVDRLLELAPGGIGNDRHAEALEPLALQRMHAAAEENRLRRDAQIETRPVPAFPVAVPEPEVEMVLVGALIPGEAHITVDAADRAVHLRLEAHTGRERLE